MTHPRGDVRLQINGEERVLRLTLGALADIEDQLGGGDFSALQERLKNPRVSDIIIVLHALIAGGGAPLAMEVLRASDLDLAQAGTAIAKAFAALGGAPGKSQAGQ